MKPVFTLAAGAAFLAVAVSVALLNRAPANTNAEDGVPQPVATGEIIETVQPRPFLSATPGGTPPEPEPTKPPPTVQPEAPNAVCDPTEAAMRNAVLGIAMCLPPGWGGWSDGKDRDSLEDLSDKPTVQLFSEEWFPVPDLASPADSPGWARAATAIRMRLTFAPDYAEFEGCTPKASSDIGPFTQFCEDVFDIKPTGEASFSPDGSLTAWKFLLPVSTRVIAGYERSGGSLYVKVVFPSSMREGSVERIKAVLATLVVR